MIRNVVFYGSFAKKYGPRHEVVVNSVTSAVRLICVQTPGLREALEQGRFRINVGAGKGEGFLLEEGTLDFELPPGDIHIVPVVGGGKSKKSGGIGKIIIGTILIAASFFVPVGGSVLFQIGLAVAISGVSQLLSPNKKSEKPKRSYMDSGPQTAGQGSCVPLVVGRYLTTPILVSAGVSVADSNGLV